LRDDGPAIQQTIVKAIALRHAAVDGDRETPIRRRPQWPDDRVRGHRGCRHLHWDRREEQRPGGTRNLSLDRHVTLSNPHATDLARERLPEILPQRRLRPILLAKAGLPPR